MITLLGADQRGDQPSRPGNAAWPGAHVGALGGVAALRGHPGIRLIILDRFVKALVLGLGGIVLLVVTETGGLRDFTHQL